MALSIPAISDFRVLFNDYYLFNLLILCSYAVLRWKYADSNISTPGNVQLYNANTFKAFEQHALLTVLAMSLYSYARARSAAAAGSAVMKYCQIFVLGMAFVCNKLIFVYYGLSFLAIMALFPQPFDKEFTQLYEALLPEALTTKVMAGSALANDATSWVVVYYTVWSPAFRLMSSDLANLASRYHAEHLRFACVGVEEFPALAKKLDIEVSATSVQLPTVVLYEHGVEVCRLPRRKGGKGSWEGKEFRKADLISAFELDRRRVITGDAGNTKKSK